MLSTLYLGEEGPAVEVPLDGTIYDLESGKVPLTSSAVANTIMS